MVKPTHYPQTTGLGNKVSKEHPLSQKSGHLSNVESKQTHRDCRQSQCAR